ncbi:MAG: cupin domain-containing protein [Gemmatimonadota bacterium]|jgi:mannose-6-phosphate isomerase-like protein (cupin superfamily)
MEAVIRKQELKQESWTPERCFIYETWNDEADRGLSVARARVEAGTTTQLHALDGIDERYLIVEGFGLVEVAAEEPTSVQAGDFVFIPAGVSQRIRNTGGSDLIFFCICTPPFIPEAYINLEGPNE